MLWGEGECMGGGLLRLGFTGKVKSKEMVERGEEAQTRISNRP